MKTNCWLILGTMVATTAVAQVDANKLPQIPPPAPSVSASPAPAVAPEETKTNAPSKRTKKKSAHKAKSSAKAEEKKHEAHEAKEAKHHEASEEHVTLVAGPATVTGENVNLRGQAGLKGEVVGHVKKGDTVTVLSEINLDKAKAGEPAEWAKISLPSGSKVWIDSHYVDAASKTVAAKKLNLRGGPGENYSVLGVIEKGAPVSALSTKGGWTEIDAPADAFAFIAASYLKQEAPGMQNANPPVQPVTPPAENVPSPTPTTVAAAPQIAPPVTQPVPNPQPMPVMPPAAPPTMGGNPSGIPAPTPTFMPTPTLAPETDTNVPPPPRVVTHEGSVRHSVSLVAPTYFELYDPGTEKAIDYLYTTSTNLNLARYDGLHITVTGEEAMDPRWNDTPVLTIQKIYVLSADNQKKSSGHSK